MSFVTELVLLLFDIVSMFGMLAMFNMTFEGIPKSS
jgi:hypothetical protein